MNNISKRNIFACHPKKTIVCFIIAAICAIDFFSATVYRVITGYPWANNRIQEAKKLAKTYRIPSEFYHHGFDRRKTGDAIWGKTTYTIYTNSLGFRDKSIRNIAPVSDKHRIVFIGDSFVEGVGVDYQYTFVGLIDEILSKKGIMVLNAAVDSYSPIIYWRKVKHLIEDIGLKFDELVVFLDISDAHDEIITYCLNENGNVIKVGHRDVTPRTFFEKLKAGIRNNSILIYVALNRLYDVFSNEREGSVNSQRSLWTVDDEIYQEYGNKGLQKMQSYMDKLYDLLKKNNIRLTVAVYPWPDQIMYDELSSIQVTFWRDWCGRHDVDFINYFPYFMIGKTEDERKQMLDKYYINRDVHWNKKGHRLVADIFLTFKEKM